MFRSVVVKVSTLDELQKLANLNVCLAETLPEWELILVVENMATAEEENARELLNNKFLNARAIFLAGKVWGRASALWAGVDIAIGDQISAVFEVPENPKDLLVAILAADGADVLFGYCGTGGGGGFLGRIFENTFRFIYKITTKTDLAGTQPAVVVMTRQFINFLQKSNSPELAMRNANMFHGFNKRQTIVESATYTGNRDLSASFGRSMEIIFSASVAPLRAISLISLTGAAVNLIYSVYVLVVALTERVTPGWTSMSLQLSGMFFLVTVVLASLSEFLIYLQRQGSSEAKYFIRSQLTSRRTGFAEQLNVTE